QAAIDAAMRTFELTKSFPPEERYSMVDQMRRCSRSVCATLEKRGGNDVIRHTLLANSAIPKVRRKKLEYGSSSHGGAAILKKCNARIWINAMTEFLVSSLE